MSETLHRQTTTGISSSRLPNWVKVVPFVVLHLALLTVFLVSVEAGALILCAVTYSLRMFGITAGYHRYFAHRAYKTSRAFQFVLAWLGCSAMQKGPLWWAGHHRGHHRHSDTPKDPHSPYETTFWWSHVGWILSSEHGETPWEQIQDWSRYPELRWLDRNHWVPGVVLAVLCWLCGGWSGLVWGFVVSTILVYHATFTINSLSHLFGSRRYATTDDSRNNWLLALLTLGEGWHNNHHHYQSSANQGFFWWEIDISYYGLLLLRCLGLVWDLRKPGEKALTHQLLRPMSPAGDPVSRPLHDPVSSGAEVPGENGGCGGVNLPLVFPGTTCSRSLRRQPLSSSGGRGHATDTGSRTGDQPLKTKVLPCWSCRGKARNPWP